MKNFNSIFNQLTAMPKRLAMVLTVLFTLGVGSVLGETTYNFSNISTSGWKTAGGTQSINGKTWTYSSSTYIGCSDKAKIQVGSSKNPQTSNWTIQIPISSFGTNIKVTKVAITAYTTATTATYDISVGGASVKSGSLTTNSATYSINTLNATTGNIVVTLKGSNNSKAMYLSNISVTYEETPAWKLKGDWDSWVEHAMTVSGTEASCKVTLAAGKRYEFGFDGNGAFYKNNGVIIVPISGWVFNTSDGNCKLHTGPAGEYTFKINTSNKQVTVIYPEVTHPHQNYVYFKNSDVWGTVKGYLGNTENSNKASEWPGIDMPTTTICGETYHYGALSDCGGLYNVIIFNNGNSGYGNQTSDLTVSGSGGKYNANRDANWHDFTTYTIIFKGNGNTGGSMTNVSGIPCEGSTTLVANGYTRTGYTFSNWKTNVAVTANSSSVAANGTVANNATLSNITSNITLTAQWKANTYTITYKDGGNTNFSGTHESGYPTTHTYGTATTLKNATKTGYTFDGWYKESACTNKVTSLGANAYTANITLYAKWTPITYYVKFNANGGSGSMSNQTFTYGTAQNLTANAYVRTGYAFKHWTINQDGTGTSYSNEQSVSNLTAEDKANVTLYAQWTKVHTITWNVAGDESNTTTVLDGEKVVLPSDPKSCSDEYNTFVGWYTQAAGEESNPSAAPLGTQITADTKPNDDVTYYAVWADGGESSEVVDVLNRDFTGVSGTSYASWSGKTATSSAIYTGESSGGPDNNTPCIQLRSSTSNDIHSGIVTTVSGGKATKIVVTWNSKTTDGRKLDVYGKSTTYSAPSDLYNNSNSGTLIGSIVYGTSSELEINGNYEYIGLRSNSGAMYLDEIKITWSVGADATGYISTCCANSINIIKGAEVNGTFDVTSLGEVASCDGVTVTVTPTPASHYHVKSVTATNPSTAGSAQVVDNGDGTWNVTYTANSNGDTQIDVEFEEDTKFDVRWYVNGVALTGAELGEASTKVYENDKVEKIPDNPAPPCGGMFVGWTVAEMDVDDTDEPNELYTQQSEFPDATGNQEFFAVFADYEE